MKVTKWIRLLWPKRINERIRELKKNGALNVKAVDTYAINSSLLLAGVFLLALIAYLEGFYILLALFLIVSPLLVHFEAKHVYDRFSLPYDGASVEAKLEQVIVYAGFMKAKRFLCNVAGTKVRTNKIYFRKMSGPLPQAGDSVKLLVRDGRYMPDIKEIRERYDLKASM